jgi:hypothetical protein
MWDLAPLLIPVGTGLTGLTGLLIYIGRSLIAGKLVPERTHVRELALKQESIDRLEAALTRSEAALAKVMTQRDQLLGLAMATAEVVQAIPKAKDTVS